MKRNIKAFGILGTIVYAVILFSLLTFYRLPAEKIFASAIGHFSREKVFLEIKKASPGLPFRYALEDISYGIETGGTFQRDTLDTLIIKLDLLRLITGCLPLKFEALPGRGRIQGRIGLSLFNAGNQGYLDLKINDVHLEDLRILNALAGRNVKGRLKGELTTEGNPVDLMKLNGSGRFTITQGGVETKFDIPGMNTIPFESVEVLFSVHQGMFKLERGQMNGPMFSGNYTGEIALKDDISMSQIDIRGEMKPGPMIDENKFVRQLLSQVLKGDAMVKVRVGGTIESPTIFRSRS